MREARAYAKSIYLMAGHALFAAHGVRRLRISFAAITKTTASRRSQRVALGRSTLFLGFH